MSEGISGNVHHSSLVISLHDGKGPPSLDRKAYCDLTSMLNCAAGDDAIRTVIFRGFAGCFCRGANLDEFTDPEIYPGLIEAVTGYFRALSDFPKPLLASVDGEATGVGCTTLFHCDLVFASQSSTFRVPFVDFGLIPDAATSLLAPERLGYMQAFRFFCLGEVLDAKKAQGLNLVSEVCEGHEEDTFENALTFARALAKKPATALETTRRLLRGEQSQVRSRIDQEIALFRDALSDEKTLKRIKRLASLAA